MEDVKSIDNLDMVRLNIQLTKKCDQRSKSCNSYLMKADNEMSTADIIRADNEFKFGGKENVWYENIFI